MIVFDLSCPVGHRFEGWFGSSADFSSQTERGLVTCPQCGSSEIAKAPMAPAVPRKGNQLAGLTSDATNADALPAEMPPEVAKALQEMARQQAKALEKSQWVGGDFAEQSRAMHYGESKQRMIHGQATMEEARDLHEEGIPVAPILFPIAPPDDIN